MDTGRIDWHSFKGSKHSEEGAHSDRCFRNYSPQEEMEAPEEKCLMGMGVWEGQGFLEVRHHAVHTQTEISIVCVSV